MDNSDIREYINLIEAAVEQASKYEPEEDNLDSVHDDDIADELDDVELEMSLPVYEVEEFIETLRSLTIMEEQSEDYSMGYEAALLHAADLLENLVKRNTSCQN